MTYELLDERGGVQWPCNRAHPDGTARLYTDAQFPTDWKISESYRKDLETGHERTLREYRNTADPGGGRAVLIDAAYEPPLEEPDEEYPFTAITGRQAYHWHTRTKTGRAPALELAAPEVFVSLAAADAESLGIRHGDAVRVISRRGELTGSAKVGDVVPSGVIFIPFHYGELGRGTAANELMPKTHDPVSKQPIQKSAAVRLERVDGSSRARRPEAGS
jgi:anaerobic selenocysteine-containing dehydrogenase